MAMAYLRCVWFKVVSGDFWLEDCVPVLSKVPANSRIVWQKQWSPLDIVVRICDLSFHGCSAVAMYQL